MGLSALSRNFVAAQRPPEVGSFLPPTSSSRRDAPHRSSRHEVRRFRHHSDAPVGRLGGDATLSQSPVLNAEARRASPIRKQQSCRLSGKQYQAPTGLARNCRFFVIEHPRLNPRLSVLGSAQQPRQPNYITRHRPRRGKRFPPPKPFRTARSGAPAGSRRAPVPGRQFPSGPMRHGRQTRRRREAPPSPEYGPLTTATGWRSSTTSDTSKEIDRRRSFIPAQPGEVLLPAFATFYGALDRYLLRTAKPISRSQRNGGFGAHSERARISAGHLSPACPPAARHTCVAQETVGRPGQIGDLREKLRLDPVRPGKNERRSEARAARRRQLRGEVVRASGSRWRRRSARTLTGIPVPTRPT